MEEFDAIDRRAPMDKQSPGLLQGSVGSIQNCRRLVCEMYGHLKVARPATTEKRIANSDISGDR